MYLNSTNPLSRRTLLQMAPLLAAAQALPLAHAQVTQPSRRNHPLRADRGVWIHPERYFTTRDAKQGRAQVQAMVHRYAEAGFNLLMPWTVSGYLVAVEDARQQERHPSAAWDALGVILEEAKAAGLNVDIWYSFTEYRGPQSPEFDPSYKGDPAWRAISANKDKTRKDEADGAWNVCPAHAAARRWQLELLERSLARYRTARALHIEEPGFDSKDYCLCSLCRSLYQQINNGELRDNLYSSQAEDLKTIGSSAFMCELRSLLAQKYPQLLLTVNGGNDWRRDRKRGRDWGRWALSGWLDSFIPQVYEESVESFRKNFALTLNDLGHACAVQAGIALSWSEGKNDINMVMRQIDAALEMGSEGVLLFHGAAFTESDLKELKKGPFRI